MLVLRNGKNGKLKEPIKHKELNMALHKHAKSGVRSSSKGKTKVAKTMKSKGKIKEKK